MFFSSAVRMPRQAFRSRNASISTSNVNFVFLPKALTSPKEMFRIASPGAGHRAARA
jgi:hypothetical protein